MIKVVTKSLPHKLGVSNITNLELKVVVSAFMENFNSITNQLAEVQEALRELQRKER